jgi:acetyl esterase
VSLHPQVQAQLDLEGAGLPGSAGPADLEAKRAGYLQTALERGGALELVDATEDIVIATAGDARISARVYKPLNGARVPGGVVWFHGGGWLIGDLEGFDWVSRSLSNAAGARLASVDYRLAPEHPFPAAVEDADAAVRWASELGPVVIGGDSAGGNLAAVAPRHARDAGLDVRAQILVYPATDASMAGESYRKHDMPLLTADEMKLCWSVYRGDAAAEDPDVSPLRAADLAGLPPTLIAVAGHDVLRDDGVRYAEALQEAGVDVRLDMYEDMAHGFLRWAGVVERSRELIDSLGAFAAERLANAKDPLEAGLPRRERGRAGDRGVSGAAGATGGNP